jgi:hypothetical protein
MDAAVQMVMQNSGRMKMKAAPATKVEKRTAVVREKVRIARVKARKENRRVPVKTSWRARKD